MVRLKVVSFAITTTPSRIFQFQYGAIERSKRHYRSPHHRLFQFQYGAIESANCLQNKEFNLLFQFQYGAIESGYGTSRATCQVISIPVWCDWKKAKGTFNIRKNKRFQFQYGAIERSQLVHIYMSISEYFNSSMVRLKAEYFLFPVTMPPYFNSSMVRLKGQLPAK